MDSAVSCYKQISRLNKTCNTSCTIIAHKMNATFLYVPTATMPLLGVQMSWCTSSYIESLQNYSAKIGTGCQPTPAILTDKLGPYVWKFTSCLS